MNDVSRRSFIGTVIGFLVANPTSKFIAAEPAPFRQVGSKFEKAQRLIRLFDLDSKAISRCRIGLVMDNDEIIEMKNPIICHLDRDEGEMHFAFQPIILSEKVQAYRIIFIDDQNTQIGAAGESIVLSPGSQLAVTYKFSIFS